MVHDDDARVAADRGQAASQEQPEIDDGQKLAAHIREALDPRLGARHARHAGRHAQHLTCLLTGNEVQVAGHAQGDDFRFGRRHTEVFFHEVGDFQE